MSFDVGWDSTGEWKPEIYELFPYIDVLFMNETESVHYSRKETALEAARDFAKYLWSGGNQAQGKTGFLGGKEWRTF